ncbi:unnamed protein product [Parnassius apollo]|uniref:(apollo) hypothetical protein n=1 Tax=Parnassius apollo TaxID=110799 RepID=A0A8S3XH45_PARAO|nr:unnamed protein product [Parnassius apollo]
MRCGEEVELRSAAKHDNKRRHHTPHTGGEREHRIGTITPKEPIESGGRPAGVRGAARQSVLADEIEMIEKMANENQKNCIITGITHSFCLLCDECLKENETIRLHIECNSHKRNLELNIPLEKYKDDGIRQEYIGRGDCGNAQYASRKSTVTSPHSPKQAESGCHEGSEPNANSELCETDSILFGAALAVCCIIGAKVSTAGRATGQSSAIPAWRRRIEERIAMARALIGRLICFRSGNNRPKIVRTVRTAFAGTNVSLSQPDITQKLTVRIDDLKQRIAAFGKRIRRYTERSTRFNQNRLFQSDQKRLCESLERPMVSGTGPAPNQADTVAFWRGLWSELVNHREGPWTEVVASQCASITSMDPVIITPDDVAEAVRRAPNWKSPGLDGLHHYWLKGFVVKKGFHCESCDILFATKQAIKRHVNEMTHINNKGLLLLKKVENGVVAFNNIFIEDKAWHGLIDNTCIICNVDVPDENSHKNNSSHIFNLILNKPEFNENNNIFRKVDGECYNCLVCNSISSMDTISMHFKNEYHLEKYMKCKELYIQLNTSNQKRLVTENDATDNEKNAPNTIQDKLLKHKIELDAKKSDKSTLKKDESKNKVITKTPKNKKETDPIKIYDESKKDNAKASSSENIGENHKNISSKLEGKIIEQELSHSKVHESHEAIEIAYKFAKENGLKISFRKRYAYCNACDIRISSSLKHMEDHISNALHKENISKSPMEKFMKTYTLIETVLGEKFVILNKIFCIALSSFHIITHNENTVRCQLCERNIVHSLELHSKTQHHKTLLNKAEVIVVWENEFIRKVKFLL